MAVIMSYKGNGNGNRSQDCRPGYSDCPGRPAAELDHPAAGDHREPGKAGCPVGRGRAKSKGSGRMPGLQPKGDGKPTQPRKPRKRRSRGVMHTCMTPTQRVEHVLEQCPDCGTQLSGGSTHHTREVIDLPRLPTSLCAASATGGGGAGPTASGDQPAQLDCRPTGRTQAAFPRHPVVPGHSEPAAYQRGGHRGRHSKGGSNGPEGAD